MTAQFFQVNGATLLPDLSGALYWPAAATLVVADLHLEKGSAFALRGQLLPPYDSRATLTALAATVARHRPRRVVCLGDSFHDDAAAARLGMREAHLLRDMAQSHDWIWVAGNHDPAPPTDWGGRVVEEVTIGPLVFRHEAASGKAAGEISGHFHPKAAVSVRGRRLTARCFVTDGRRLILPAFGAYAGGLDVRDPAISGLLRPAFTVHMLGRDRVHRFPSGRLS